MFDLFNTDGFVARRVCGDWTPGLVALHVVSNFVIFLAYISIPSAIAYFLYKRRDIPFRGVFMLFFAFIMCCGLTHLLDSLMFYWPAYRLLGVGLAVTAVVSVATVFGLWWHMRLALLMPSHSQLEAEVKRREASEHKYASLFADSPAGMVVGDEDGTLLNINQTYCDMLGYTEEELMALGWCGVTPKDDLPQEEKDLRSWVAAGCPTMNYRKRYVRKDGKIIHVELYCKRVADQHNLVMVVDRTAEYEQAEENRRLAAELKNYSDALESQVNLRTEELGKANARLRQAAKQKDQFLAMLGHELRNPLAPILNALSVMRVKADKSEPQDMIERQVRNLVRIVDDLLDVSRINSGKVQLRTEPTDLSLVVARAAQASRSIIDTKMHAMFQSIPRFPVWANIDSTRIEQVIGNLLTNAAKYTEPGGKIHLSMEALPDRAVIRVRDNGIGIRPDMLKAVFDSFVQTERSLERAQGGLGLGLAIVKKLTEMHGGTVKADSAGPNQGSEFTVTLPLCEAPPPPKEERNERALTPRRSILVVDDNTDAADSLRDLLELEGHTVDTAYDGEEAMRKVADDTQVVLLDIGLPKMNGYMVAKALRRERQLKKIILVALTGYGQAEDKEAAVEAGFNAHFTKPMDPVKLRKFLEDCIEDSSDLVSSVGG